MKNILNLGGADRIDLVVKLKPKFSIVPEPNIEDCGYVRFRSYIEKYCYYLGKK